MSYTKPCPKCRVGTLGFLYEPGQEGRWDDPYIPSQFICEEQDCECEFTDAEMRDIEEQALHDAQYD